MNRKFVGSLLEITKFNQNEIDNCSVKWKFHLVSIVLQNAYRIKIYTNYSI